MAESALHERLILACFKDRDDERHFSALMKDIPGLVTLCGVSNLYLVTGNEERHDAPQLVILSSRLYPEVYPELVQEMKTVFPQAEFLLVTPPNEPLPQFDLLARDKVRHLAVTPLGVDLETGSSLKEVIGKLIDRKVWSILDYVRPGTPVHYVSISSSWQKEALIASVEQLIEGDEEEFELLRQKAALLADEMLENALYGAPQGKDGRKLYRKGDVRVTQEDEEIHFRFAFDGKNLAMEIADGWGTLSPDQVVSYLAKNHKHAEIPEDTGGRGLFIIWRFMDHFHVSIRPGRQTVLGGHLNAFSLLDPEAPKGFSISTYL